MLKSGTPVLRSYERNCFAIGDHYNLLAYIFEMSPKLLFKPCPLSCPDSNSSLYLVFEARWSSFWKAMGLNVRHPFFDIILKTKSHFYTIKTHVPFHSIPSYLSIKNHWLSFFNYFSSTLYGHLYDYLTANQHTAWTNGCYLMRGRTSFLLNALYLN